MNLGMLRLMQAFPPMAQPGLDTYSGSSDQSADNTPSPSAAQGLMNQYQPSTAISSQLESTLADMPERQPPGKLRSIGAALTGLGAGAGAQGIVGGQPIGFKFNPQEADYAKNKVEYGDFNDKMSDWQNKTRALTLGASEEDRRNTNERIRQNNVETNSIKQQEADIRQQRADSYQQNADTAIEKERNVHEFKMRQHADNIAEKDKALAIAKQNADTHRDSTEYLRKFHNAELASIDARRKAQTEDDEFKLKDQKRRTDSIIERNRILNENTGGSRISNTVVYGPDGKVQQSLSKTTGPTGSQILTDPDGNPHDVSTWTEADKTQAKLRGWK